MYLAHEDDVDAAFDAPIKVMPLQQKNAKAVLMNRRINACTKGLLEASTSDTQDPEHYVEVAFVHRTVRTTSIALTPGRRSRPQRHRLSSVNNGCAIATL